MQSVSVPLGDRNPRGHTAAEVLSALAGRATWIEYVDDTEVAGMGGVLVDQGEDAWLTLITSVDYTLRLYVGDPIGVLSYGQIEALTEDDFTEASFAGYEAKTLTGGSWVIAAAVATYAKKGFVSSANQISQVTGGYYLTRVTTGELMMFEEFQDPVTVSGSGQVISVTPRITLGEETGS
jgi:hypothetical protein